MKSSIRALLATTAFAAMASVGMGSTPAAATNCPAFGFDIDCGFVIVINPGGTLTITPTGIGGYDSLFFADDTLIGVVNNSGQTVTAIHLTSTTTAFAFDGCDGIQCFGSPSPVGFPLGYELTSYEGPDNYFSNVSPGGLSDVGGLAQSSAGI